MSNKEIYKADSEIFEKQNKAAEKASVSRGRCRFKEPSGKALSGKVMFGQVLREETESTCQVPGTLCA